MAVITGAFSGRSGFWVQWQDVKEFGESLSIYPITLDAPLSAEWGYEMQKGDDLMLSVEVSPKNTTGDLLVRVVVADFDDPTKRVRTSFVTNYPDLEAFRLAIAQLMNREIEEAVLEGH